MHYIYIYICNAYILYTYYTYIIYIYIINVKCKTDYNKLWTNAQCPDLLRT